MRGSAMGCASCFEESMYDLRERWSDTRDALLTMLPSVTSMPTISFIGGSEARWLFSVTSALLARTFGVQVTTRDRYGLAQARGYYDPKRCEVYVKRTAHINDMARVLLHEAAHVRWALALQEEKIISPASEVHAEGVALLVGATFGFDFSAVSLPYMAWHLAESTQPSVMLDVLENGIVREAHWMARQIGRLSGRRSERRARWQRFIPC